MLQFTFSLYVYPIKEDAVHFDMLLSLTKSFKPSKRVFNEWTFLKVLDEYVYVFAKDGFVFKMICKKKHGHLYFSRFYVYMYDEETGDRYEEDKIFDYILYVYDYNKKHKIPIVSVEKDMPEIDFNFLKLV